MNKLAGVTASGSIAEEAYLGLTKFAGEKEEVRRARYMELTGINSGYEVPAASGSKRARTE